MDWIRVIAYAWLILAFLSLLLSANQIGKPRGPLTAGLFALHLSLILIWALLPLRILEII